MSFDAGQAGSTLPSTVTAVDSAGAQSVTASSAAADGTAALRAVGLTLSFGQRAILSDISVDVQRGAVTALIGPTG
jgi:ABC-type transport system involved in cytochrome bd biosynthesis fused ATPase/permease subunit